MRLSARTVLTLCTVLLLAVIWGHSMVPAVLSGEESGSILLLLNTLLRGMGLPTLVSDFIVRKAAHFTEYFLLGFLLSATLRSWGRPVPGTLQALLLLVVPFVDETIQLFVPGRSGQVSDMWLDLAGGWSGAILCCGIMAVILHKKVQR